MILLLGLAGASWAAGVNTGNPNLPPDLGEYVGREDIIYNGGALQVILRDLHLKPQASTALRTKLGPDEREDFTSTLSALVNVNGSPFQPSSGSGPEQTLTFGKVGNVTGTFNSEMTLLNLSGSSPFGPFMIRESPTLATLGQTSITNLGGGQFHIDSFFDVFTELSVDGGATWIPSSGSDRFTLMPEPGALTLMVLVGIGLGTRRRVRA
jgi:hypothetical protein